MCAAVRFIVLKATWDKGGGSRYVHWKILHSRWTVVLQLVIKCVTVNII